MEANRPLSPEFQVEFPVEKYKLDRDAELEVYKALHGYEHAGLRTLLALNGGAAAAFLTLLGAIWGDQGIGKSSTMFSLVAIVAWTIGLGVTGLALRRMYHAHHCLARQFRYRRMAEELSRGVRRLDRYLHELTRSNLRGLASDLKVNFADKEEDHSIIQKICESKDKTLLKDKSADRFIDQVIDCDDNYREQGERGRQLA